MSIKRQIQDTREEINLLCEERRNLRDRLEEVNNEIQLLNYKLEQLETDAADKASSIKYGF